MLGHAHPDAVAGRVDHGLEMTGRVDPVVQGVLGGILCAGEHGEVIPEAVGVGLSSPSSEMLSANSRISFALASRRPALTLISLIWTSMVLTSLACG